MTRAILALGLLLAAPAQAQDSFYYPSYSSGYVVYDSFSYSEYGDSDTDSDSDSDSDADSDADSDSDADAEDEEDTGAGDDEKSLCSAGSAVGGWAALALAAGFVASRRRKE